eukprot:gene24576-27793_t
MSLYGAMPNSYKRLFDPVGSYPYWLPLTQWLPFVFCSFSLVYMMRFKGGGADRTNSMRLDGNIDMQTIRTIRESCAEDRESEDVVSPLDHKHHRTRSVGMSTDAFGGRSLSFLMYQNNPILSGQQPPSKTRDLFRNSEAPDRDSDTYSAFGAERESSLSATNNVDNFFNVTAMQRSTSAQSNTFNNNNSRNSPVGSDML